MEARFTPSDAMKFGLARRGSGEGFHSPEARTARTEKHEENRANKVTMHEQEQAWTQRFGEPTNASLPFEAHEFRA